MSTGDKVQLQSENFYSFSSGKTGLLNKKKKNNTISVTPSPKKVYEDVLVNLPEFDFSTSSQSTTPTATHFSMSSKSNILVCKSPLNCPVTRSNSGVVGKSLELQKRTSSLNSSEGKINYF